MQTVNQFIQNGARSRRGAPFSARTISRPSLLVLHHVLALMLVIAIGNGPLMAQSNTGICADQSSIQYPLWGDGIKWNRPGLYNSIQLADIDGDGQDELLGYGPFGIEIWHWDPNGLAWLKMRATPPDLRRPIFFFPPMWMAMARLRLSKGTAWPAVNWCSTSGTTMQFPRCGGSNRNWCRVLI